MSESQIETEYEKHLDASVKHFKSALDNSHSPLGHSEVLSCLVCAVSEMMNAFSYAIQESMLPKFVDLMVEPFAKIESKLRSEIRAQHGMPGIYGKVSAPARWKPAHFVWIGDMVVGVSQIISIQPEIANR